MQMSRASRLLRLMRYSLQAQRRQADDHCIGLNAVA
jgi:hypothetical protein